MTAVHQQQDGDPPRAYLPRAPVGVVSTDLQQLRGRHLCVQRVSRSVHRECWTQAAFLIELASPLEKLKAVAKRGVNRSLRCSSSPPVLHHSAWERRWLTGGRTPDRRADGRLRVRPVAGLTDKSPPRCFIGCLRSFQVVEC